MDAGIEALQGQREVDRVDVVEIMTSEDETRERRGGDQDGGIQCLAGRSLPVFVAIERPIGGRPAPPGTPGRPM